MPTASAATSAPTALRDALTDAAFDAAKYKAVTDPDMAERLWTVAGLTGVACCDETAIAMLAAAPPELLEEVAGATKDTWVIAAVEVARGIARGNQG